MPAAGTGRTGRRMGAYEPVLAVYAGAALACAPAAGPFNVLGGTEMTEIQKYLAEEIAEDLTDGIITRREAMRRLGLLGLTASAATTLLATFSAPASRRRRPPRPGRRPGRDGQRLGARGY